MDDGTLHAYLDGELSPVERGRLETHLAECPACRQRRDEERDLIGRASAVLGFARPAERPAPPLEGLHPARRSWWISRPLAWAATVVLAVGFGYYLRGADAVRSAPKQLESVAVTADSVGPAEPARPSAEVADRMMYSGQDRDDSAVRQPPVRTESVGKIAPAAGVVGFRDAPPLRQAAPEPVPPAAPPQAAAPVAAYAALEEARGRLVATEWPIIRREPARRLLGADPLGVPGLAVRGIRRSPAGDGVVVVEQTIDSGTVIQLFQQRVEADGLERRSARALAAEEREGARANANERLARFVGSLRIEIAGPLTPDSLNKLLALLAPIP